MHNWTKMQWMGLALLAADAGLILAALLYYTGPATVQMIGAIILMSLLAALGVFSLLGGPDAG